MKKLSSISKTLSSLNVEKLLSNQTKDIKGGKVLKADCWSCTAGCSTNCVSGQVAKVQ